MKKTIIFILLLLLALVALTGCGTSKRLEEQQYRIYQSGQTFTIAIYDSDLWSEQDISEIRVKMKYTYTTDSKTKTKTEVFDVKRPEGISSFASGTFSTEYKASEYEVKRVTVKYGTEPGTSFIETPGGMIVAAVISLPVSLIIFFLVGLVSIPWGYAIPRILYGFCVVGILIGFGFVPAIAFLVAYILFELIANFLLYKLLENL